MGSCKSQTCKRRVRPLPFEPEMMPCRKPRLSCSRSGSGARRPPHACGADERCPYSVFCAEAIRCCQQNQEAGCVLVVADQTHPLMLSHAR